MNNMQVIANIWLVGSIIANDSLMSTLMLIWGVVLSIIGHTKIGQ